MRFWVTGFLSFFFSLFLIEASLVLLLDDGQAKV
jgi:hypothetical protein